jgi:hypothetical protein
MSRLAEEATSQNPFPLAATRFFVSGDASPGLAPRVLELFAKRGLIPDEFHARAADGEMSIEIRADGMAEDVAAYIGRCLRQITSVERVLVSRDGQDGTGTPAALD